MADSKTMVLKSIVYLLLGLLAIQVFIFLGCSSSRDGTPREVVIQLFGAMERNERATLPRILDLRSLMSEQEEDYALQRNTARKFYNPEAILDDLTDSGLTKIRWFSMQRVVGNAEINGDTAFVEVSFIDKEKSIQYYNKFGLHRRKGHWKIYSFKTISR
jgi:hypothetical protein